jgi:uncharacterized membrane protein (DUF106 family)
MHPWISMLIISLLTGILMLLVFKYTSNQDAIKHNKDLIKAHLLEMRLYSSQMKVSFQAQAGILKANFKYMAHMFKPMIFVLPPLVLLLFQINLWFGYDSLDRNQAALLKVYLNEAYNPVDVDLEVSPGQGIIFETPPLRIEENNEINWRISSPTKGIHQIDFKLAGETITKQVAVAQDSMLKIFPYKIKGNFVRELTVPTEKPLKKNSVFNSIEIQYPEKRLEFLGIRFHWLVAFFILSVVFGFALKGLFRVDF